MTQKPAAGAAVGEAPFEPVYSWPPITPKEWADVEAALHERSGDPALYAFDHKVGEAAGHQRSAVHIPRLAIRADHPNLMDYIDTAAEALGRMQLRYGVRGNRYYVGFSEPLSMREALLCRDNGLWQRDLNARPVDVGELQTATDGSQTLARQKTYGADPEKTLQTRRAEELHMHVLEHIAPYLEEGVVIGGLLAYVERGGYPSLFTPSVSLAKTAQSAKTS